MSYQRTAVPLKNQTRNIFSEAQIRQGMYPLQESSLWSHMVLIYGEHASPVRSVIHMGYDKDPADIPKEGTDPTTS